MLHQKKNRYPKEPSPLVMAKQWLQYSEEYLISTLVSEVHQNKEEKTIRNFLND
jgi:hypothetical protein